MNIDLSDQRQLLARRSDLTGSERRAALTEQIDVWLRSLFGSATADSDPQKYCLVAVGGYGRGEMSLGSDIDVLLLHDPSARDVAKVSDGLWYPIWDSGIALDHSVRTVAQARVLAREDFKVILGLLDARPIAGNVELAETLRAGVLGDWRAGAVSHLGDLHATVTARRDRVGDLAQLLEPDLKEAYGGLRDAVVLRALSASWIVEVPRTTWPESVRTLLDVRDALHVRGRRDRLSMQDQDEVAATLRDTMGVGNADDLLRRVYLAARDIAYASDVAWYRALRATRRQSQGTPRVLRRLTGRRAGSTNSGPERVPLAEGVVLMDGEVALARGARPEADRGLALRVAAAAAQANAIVAPATIERLAATEHDSAQRWTKEMRESFVSLLGAGRSLLPVVEAFDQAGVVQSWIPAWAAVRSQPQRNPMHEFTVDRHLLEASIHAGQRARDVARPDLLLVGAFLHDIGKGYQGDHSIVGEPIAREIAEMMGFDDADVDTLGLLVRIHLLLPDIATRRDLDDPGTVQSVLDVIPDIPTLELLHAVTWADAEATGPSVRSSWRRNLVKDLVVRCKVRMIGDEPAPRPSTTPALEAALAETGETTVRLEASEDGCSIVVSAPERMGVLATVAGVLSLHRLQIRGARVRSSGDRAAQEWLARPLFGDLPDERAIASDVRAALAGDLDVADRLRRRGEGSQRPAGGAEPVVFIDDSPDTHTVVEVRAHDEPMLLFRITSALLAADAVVVGAKVDTLGSEVVDAFFVTDHLGRPLGPDHAGAVRTTVQATLASR